MGKLSWIGVVVLVFCFAMPAMAEDDYSKFEAYVGYSYLHYSNHNGGLGLTLNFNGATGEFGYNFMEHFAAVGEFTGYVTSQGGIPGTATVYTFQGGPRFYLTRRKVQPFAQFLVGGIHFPSNWFTGSVTGLNLDAGGGLDISVGEHFSLRPVEASYEYAHVGKFGGLGFNNVRYTAGFVLRF